MSPAKKKTEEPAAYDATDATQNENTPEQMEQLGEGREEANDRVDKKPDKADDGPGFESETPSAKALAKVGEDGDGEAYAKEKAKHRWG